MVDLYNSTNGPGWTGTSNWTVGDPCTNAWTGIGCNAANTEVTVIYLDGNNLVGTLPASLSQMTTLINLKITANTLTGPIPPFTGMTALRSIDLWGNGGLSGSIPSLAGLPVLESINVDNNKLTGAIPTFPPTVTQAHMCPNYLTPASVPPSANDQAWSAVNDGGATWSTLCTAAPVPVVATPVPTLSLGMLGGLSAMLAFAAAGFGGLRRRKG